MSLIRIQTTPAFSQSNSNDKQGGNRMVRRRILLGTVGLIVLSLVMSGCLGLLGPRTGEVGGKVTWDDKTPVVGAQVDAGGKRIVTGADGSYRLMGITYGPHDLTVTIDGEVEATKQVVIAKSPVVLNIEINKPVVEPPEPKELVVIRSELTENAKTQYPNYGANMDALIEFLGNDYDFEILTHQDVTEGKLAGAKLVLLNDQGVMDDDDIDAIKDFVEGGGKIFATYSTSIRNAALENVGFQLSDVYGVQWDTWTADSTFKKIVIVKDHPMLQRFDGEIAVGAANRHRVNVKDATVIGVRADETGNYSSVEEAAILMVSDYGVYVGFSLFTAQYFANETSADLIHSIIDYFAPGARR